VVAPASEVLRDRSEPQTSTSRQMNDDLAALRSVRSWGRETGRHDERLAHGKEKVCLKPLPGGFWGRPCREPPATTGATSPLLRHARGAHPRTSPPVHRRERRQGPRPRGSGIGATGTGLGAPPHSDKAAARLSGSRVHAHLFRDTGCRHISHPDTGSSRSFSGRDVGDFGGGRRQHGRHNSRARDHVGASRLPNRDGHLGRRARLGNLLPRDGRRPSPLR
jgi:hypothetical protein